MAVSYTQKGATRYWSNIASAIGSTEVSINLTGYNEVLMLLYNSSNYVVASAVYPINTLNGHLVNVYKDTYFLRIKDNGTKAYVEGGGVFYGEIYAR